jgi:hypothetical protein
MTAAPGTPRGGTEGDQSVDDILNEIEGNN